MSGDNYFSSGWAALWGSLTHARTRPKAPSLCQALYMNLCFKCSKYSLLENGTGVHSGGFAVTRLAFPPTERPLIKGEGKEHKQAVEVLVQE